MLTDFFPNEELTKSIPRRCITRPNGAMLCWVDGARVRFSPSANQQVGAENLEMIRSYSEAE